MMKKNGIAIFLFLCLAARLSAGGIPYGEIGGRIDAPWTPLSLSLAPGASLFTSRTPVYGMAAGLVCSIEETVYGLHFSPVWTLTGSVAGITLAPCNLYDENLGIAVGLVNLGVRDSAGCQIGVWNSSRSDRGGVLQIGLCNTAASGWQIGLLNFNDNPGTRLPFTILFNYIPEPETGSE